MDQDAKRLSRFIEQIECELEEIEGVQINGNQQLRLPHMTSISVTNIDGTRLVRTRQKSGGFSGLRMHIQHF